MTAFVSVSSYWKFLLRFILYQDELVINISYLRIGKSFKAIRSVPLRKVSVLFQEKLVLPEFFVRFEWCECVISNEGAMILGINLVAISIQIGNFWSGRTVSWLSLYFSVRHTVDI